MTLQKLYLPRKFEKILRFIYGLPASITCITGYWKDGKTDFALYLYETCKRLGLIDKGATNIELRPKEDRLQKINALSSLQYWLFNETGRKMFLYDEVMSATPKRRAMSALNVGWVETIPQFSKGRAHLIAIVQAERWADSVFTDPTFLRGVWRKLGKKTAVFNSPLLFRLGINSQYKITGLPRTNIGFYPYRQSTFHLLERNLRLDMLPVPLKCLTLYAEGYTFEKGAHKLGLTQATQFGRELRKACKTVLTYLQQPSEGKRLSTISKKLEAE